MLELCELLEAKLTLITTQHSLSQLLTLKKQQVQRQPLQDRLLRSVSVQQLTVPQEITQLVATVHPIMLVVDPTLPLPLHSQPLTQLSQLFIDFFQRQNCILRAQQIATIHQKKLCPKALMPSMLLNWFAQWTRQALTKYLKEQMAQFYLSQQAVTEETVVKNEVQKGEGEEGLSDRRKSQRRRAQSVLRTLSPCLRSAQREETGGKEEDTPLSRDVVLNALGEQFNHLYRQLEPVLKDLDCSFPRKLRNNGRRQQIIRRITEAANALIKTMPTVQNTIQYYRRSHRSTKRPFNSSCSIEASPDQLVTDTISIAKTSMSPPRRSSRYSKTIDLSLSPQPAGSTLILHTPLLPPHPFPTKQPRTGRRTAARNGAVSFCLPKLNNSLQH